jgi:amino-acid N-acetyltransferase
MSLEIMPARAADEARIRLLLEASGLTTADLTPQSLRHFLVLRDPLQLVAVVGLEPAGEVGLLRSLAVAEPLRHGGLAKRLVAAAEAVAAGQGVRELYLLTTTAARYFLALGYRPIQRELAPPAIRTMPQFTGLCPASAAFMVKQLPSRTPIRA